LAIGFWINPNDNSYVHTRVGCAQFSVGYSSDSYIWAHGSNLGRVTNQNPMIKKGETFGCGFLKTKDQNGKMRIFYFATVNGKFQGKNKNKKKKKIKIK
jgi:hypothetical protein